MGRGKMANCITLTGKQMMQKLTILKVDVSSCYSVELAPGTAGKMKEYSREADRKLVR